MRIHFFNTYEVVSPFYRDLLPALAQKGLELRVFISSAEYRPIRGPLEEAVAHAGIEISRISSNGVQPNTRLGKLWIMLAYVAGVVWRTLFGRSTDVNVFLTQPPMLALWGYILHSVRRQTYYCVTMDIYPDLAIADGLLKENALTTRAMIALSRFALQQADKVIVIGRCMQERVRSMGIPEEKMHLIPNWVNEDHLQPVAHQNNQLRKEFGLEDKFVVLYTGNAGTLHYFDDLLEVARRCVEIPDLCFAFVGAGPRRVEIEEAKRQYHLHNVRLFPFQPLSRLSESLSMGDVHFVSLRAGIEGLVVPSKAYGALAVGRPIIYQGDPTGEIAQMVDEEQIGAVIPIGSVQSLEAKILSYYNNPQQCATQGRRALRLARGQYSYKHAIERYRTVLTLGGTSR